jgi:spore coat protein U-like protein
MLTPAGGPPQDCTNSAIWTVTSLAATVSATGLVTAESRFPQASIQVSATCQGATGSIGILISSGTTYAISGTVRDVLGAPLSGVIVAPGNGINASMSATTDAAGHYRLAPLVAETVYLKATKSPYDTAQQTISLAGDVVVDFTLVRTFHLFGTITEAIVGTPITGATVEILGGPNAGRSTTTNAGSYSFDGVTPGSMTIRASKAGYDAAQQSVFQSADMPYFKVDLALTPTVGACLASVSPVAFTFLPSAGGTGNISVLPSPGRSWTAAPADSWIEIVSGTSGAGPGTVVFRFGANPESYGTRQRTGAIQIGCSATQTQSVRLSQVANCSAAVTIRGTGVFDATGGQGYLDLLTDSPWSCEWQAVSHVDWIAVNPAKGAGDGGVAITVAPNTTGAARTGTVTVAEKTVTVSQKGT